MYVSTFLELHTVLLGWMLYTVVFRILFDTGLLILPFLWLLLRNTARSVGEEKEGSNETTVMNIKGTLAAIVVVAACVMPAYEVAPSDVKYQPPKQVDGTVPDEIRGDIDPTTYKDYFGAATAPVRIPGWWVLLHSISAGITHSVIDSLPAYSDLREAKMLLASRNIEDPALGAEYHDFYLGCYRPAKRNYEILRQEGLVPLADDDAQLDWAGSPYLIAMRGGYGGAASCGGDQRYCQNAPMPLDIQKSASLRNRVGGNSCAHWWESLRTDLLDYARRDQGTIDRAVNFLKWGFGIDSAREQEDLLVRSMLENFQATQPIAGTSSSGQGVFSRVGEAVAGVGLLGAWAVAELMLGTMKQVMPILAAVMLMLVTAFIPFALLFSSYSIGGVLQVSFLVFSLIFVQAILAMVGWFDNYLISSMFESEGAWSFMSRADTAVGDANKKMLINIVLTTLYTIGPIVWLSLMGAVGIRAAQGANRMFESGIVVSTVASGVSSVSGAASTGTAGAIRGGVRGAGAATGAAAQRYRLWNRQG